MEEALQLYGYLILALLGVVAPFLIVLLSLSREGTLKLTKQYENEKLQKEENIKEQLKKIGEAEKVRVEEIDQNLRDLKAIKKVVQLAKRTAESKLFYLNPYKQVLHLFIPLLLSYLIVILATLLIKSTYYVILSVSVSLVLFAYAIFVLWQLLGIIIEVKKSSDEEKRDSERTVGELLSALRENINKGSQYFLEKVYITLNDKNIKDDKSEVELLVNKKQELKVGIRNTELRMVKNIEIGFTFPLDFIIEKTAGYSIYTTAKSQIVRYNSSLIQGNTYLIGAPLIVTPLKQGDYPIETFIKAENIEATYRILHIKVNQ